jgi:hypothetical protein
LKITKEVRAAKLAKLMESEGFEQLEELLSAVVGDSVSPAICCNEDCNYTCEMEPDQDRGWCEECQRGTMVSVLVLGGII